MIKTSLSDGGGSPYSTRVTKFGQLVTAPLDYSSSVSVTFDVPGTGYNLVEPIFGNRVVITDILLFANKSVGVGDATVTIYTSSVGPTETTESEIILTTEMLKQTSRDLVGLNFLVKGTGRWVNGKTDDDDIFCTLGYYYIPIITI